ncbi:T9SS type A sorting domain-containing protein [candidate division KSB1 bacterium]|nr:T9SS type A sorting domain-containing protein [candidate division KSB1 bacterium]
MIGFRNIKKHLPFRLLTIIWIITALPPARAQNGSVLASWSRNLEPDLGGYFLYYGTVSKNYIKEIDVQNTTSHQVDGLSINTAYYFALRAYDKQGNISHFSREVLFFLSDNNNEPAPKVTSVTLRDKTTLVIQFDRQLNRNAAERTDNYQISPEIKISSASYDAASKAVTLKTDAHHPGIEYVLRLGEITDTSEPPNSVDPDGKYHYELAETTVQSGNTESTLERVYNYPNPFNPTKNVTHIRYFLDEPCKVSISIYDVQEKPVKNICENDWKLSGEHTRDFWDGRNENGLLAATGIYFAKIIANGKMQVIKLAVTYSH